MVLEVHPNVAFAMLDRMLGGSGNVPGRIQSLTEIETIVMERIFSRAFESLQEAWKTVLDINPRLEGLETNPQFMQIVSPNETIALISLSTKIGDTTGMINLCIPHVVIEPIMPRLSVHHWFVSQKKSRAPEEVEMLESRVHRAELPISVELGGSSISVYEFLHMAPGDVIKLDQPVDEGLNVLVGSKRKYRANPGTVNGKMAVQIIDTITEEEDLNDE